MDLGGLLTGITGYLVIIMIQQVTIATSFRRELNLFAAAWNCTGPG